MKPDIIDELFKKYYNEAMLYTVTLCKNETVAEDIVSTAFYRALATADEEIKNFKPWLLTVCRNEFFGICRKNKAMSYDELTEDLADDSEEVVDRLILKDEYKALYHAIDKLNATQKEVITLFYFSGLQIKDIAMVMGKSESNIKVLLYRSRERLKELMEAAG